MIRSCCARRCAHEYVPFAGQSAALVHDVRPAGEIVRELVTGAEAALERALRSRAASSGS
jgi:enoyl-[acyl-carrier protein] reductase II